MAKDTLLKITRGVGNQRQEFRFVPGAYEIRHVPSDLKYVGSTDNVTRRESEHFSMLRAGKHSCQPLQRLFDENPDPSLFEYRFAPTSDRDQAFDLEQKWISENSASGHLVNVAEDARSSTKGRIFGTSTRQKLREARLGKPLSPEHKEKVVAALRANVKTGEDNPTARGITVDGTKYGSIKQAAETLGIEKSTLRLRGLNPRFPNVILD